MSDRVQFRRDTKARWSEVNPVLMEGEIGLEIDTNNIKMGDGVHAWNELEYGVGIENITSELGDSENLAASQKLVKVELDKKFGKESILQELGDDENSVMSQKATTDAISAANTKNEEQDQKLSELAINKSIIRIINNGKYKSVTIDKSKRIISCIDENNIKHEYLDTVFHGEIESNFTKHIDNSEYVEITIGKDKKIVEATTVFGKKIIFGDLEVRGNFNKSDSFVNDIAMPKKLYMFNNVDNDIYKEPMIKLYGSNEVVRFKHSSIYRQFANVTTIKTPANNSILETSLRNLRSDAVDTIKTISTIIKSCNANLASETFSNLNVQVIGDSFTQGEFYYYGLEASKYAPNVTLVGTVKAWKSWNTSAHHEGRSGWSLDIYSSVVTNGCHSPFWQPNGNYRYWGNIDFWKQVYINRENQNHDLYTGYVEQLNLYYNQDGTLKSPLEGDIMFFNSENKFKVFNGSSWIDTTKESYTWGFDYSKYCSMYSAIIGGVPDVIFFTLGLDDFRYYSPNTIEEFATVWDKKVELLKTSYLSKNPNGKFVICIPCSTIGTDTNTIVGTNAVGNDNFPALPHRSMFYARKHIIDTYDGRESSGIYVVDTGLMYDYYFGFLTTEDESYTKPFSAYQQDNKIENVQFFNPHPTNSYRNASIAMAAFIQNMRNNNI